MNLFQAITNRVFFRKTRIGRYLEQLRQLDRAYAKSDADGAGDITEFAADAFLTILLNLMALVLCFNRDYNRSNIKDFKAKYVFMDKSKKLYVTAEFKKTWLLKRDVLKVRQKQMKNPDFTLKFKNGRSFFKLIFSDTPDVLDAMLNQEVDFDGNLNYINKFAYMAMRLKLMAMGKVKW